MWSISYVAIVEPMDNPASATAANIDGIYKLFSRQSNTERERKLETADAEMREEVYVSHS